MVSLAYLDINVWISEWLSQPNLIILYKPAPTVDKTIQYFLVDMNGTVVTDTASTTLTAGTEKISINLGDFINAQKSLYGFGAGLYFVIVKIVEDNAVFALPLFISEVSISDPPTGRDNLDHFFIIDKITGYMMKLPATLTPIPVDSRYMVFAYYHYQGKGRIVHFDSTGTKFDTGYHKFVKMKLKLSFSSLEDMLYHMLMRSWNIPDTVVERIITEINNGNYTEVFNLLRPYYSFTWIGRTVKIDFDSTKYEITITTYTYLGQFDWSKILSWGAFGCSVAVGVAMLATALTAGVGSITLPLVAGACLAGGATGIGLAIITSTSSGGDKAIIEDAKSTAEEGKSANQDYYNQAKTVLDNWLSQGKITQTDYDKMKQILDDWYAKMNAVIDELVADVQRAYDVGKSEGRDEMKTWAIAGTVGGFTLGLLLGRR